MKNKLATNHLERRACVYVRQSTQMQVHDHVESTKRQYALVERAIGLGWGRNDVEVIDEDQGKSGASVDERTGFVRLANAVGHGEVGAIFAVEVSRLARSSIDWQRLLALCAVTRVVVIDEQGIYDPADRDDRLLLDLKGTMSEAELHWMRLRLVGGRLNKARRGALQMTPPIGYVWHGDHFALDPDEAVQRAVRLVFGRFAIEPSLAAVVRWAHQNSIKFPRRVGPVDGSGEVKWGALRKGRLSCLLNNPTYAGVYAYGRRQRTQIVVDGEIRSRRKRLAENDWAVRIVDAHPAYIDWETFVSNQERLRRNHARMHGAIGGTAPKEGPALLTGIAFCGRCGGRMYVNYTSHEQVTWRYVCSGDDGKGEKGCWTVRGAGVDRIVEELFLKTMVPEEIDLTIAVENEASSQARSLEGQWQARLEQARYEARRAERRYKAVDAENRVVARTLEREWEARLQDLDEVDRKYADARRARLVELGDRDRAALREIARDLPSLWRAPTTTAAERKAMLRVVIEMVCLAPVDIPVRSTRVQIQWRSGAVDHEVVERPSYKHAVPPTALLDRVRALLDEGLSNEQIAKQLNEAGLRTARQNPWNPAAVSHLRQNFGLRRAKPHRFPFLPDRHPETGRYSVPGTARRFGVTTNQVKLWVRRGLVPMLRERFGRYDNVWWLDIDDARAQALERLVQQHQSK